MPVGIVNLMTMTHDALVGQGEEDFLRSLWRVKACPDESSHRPHLSPPKQHFPLLYSRLHFCLHVCQEKLLKGTRHFKPYANSSSSCYTLFEKFLLNCDNRYSLSEDLLKINLPFTIIFFNRSLHVCYFYLKSIF